MQSQRLCLRLMHVKAAFSSPCCCQISGLLRPRFSLERKKKSNQDRSCCCSSPAVALLCCPALISFQSGTALPLLIHQGFLQSLRLAYSYIPASHCPRRCLVRTGVCSSVFQLDSHQISLSRTAKIPPVCNTKSWTISHGPADLSCTSLPALPVLLLCWESLCVGWASTWGLLCLTLQSWGSPPRLCHRGGQLELGWRMCLWEPYSWQQLLTLLSGFLALMCLEQLVGGQSEQLWIFLSLPLWLSEGILTRRIGSSTLWVPSHFPSVLW